MDPMKQKNLDDIARIAVSIEQKTGVPARATIAQWAIESAWGTNPIGISNYFGIKKAERHRHSVSVPTREVIDGREERVTAEFADYDSLEESAIDYAWLISHGEPYREAWKHYLNFGEIRPFLRIVASQYATDPRYADLVIAVSEQSNVWQAISRAHGWA
jgi:flagellum-specific peptidoglycan hydrolase FlgJ